MLNPGSIHKKAAAARRKESNQQARRTRKPRGKSFFPLSPESRKVFHRIYPHGPNNFITLLLPLLLFVIGLVLWYTDKKNFGIVMPWIWALPGFVILTRLIYVAREFWDYRHYKNWRETLGFTVHGWEHLGQRPDFPHWKFWDRNTRLRIQVKPNAPPSVHPLLTDMLYLCTVEANGNFYEADQVQPGAAGDLRYRWGHTGELEISGSANSAVIGELYLFIDKQVRALHQQTDSIESVTIQFSKDLLEVQPVQVTD